MIKPEELRLNNYIIRKDLGDQHDRIERILEIGRRAATSGPVKVICDYEDLEPIPLTEELLVKAGFERGGYEQLTVRIGNFELHGDCPADYPDDKTRSLGVRMYGKLDVYVEYLHQLQNLYFALTGTELTIKL